MNRLSNKTHPEKGAQPPAQNLTYGLFGRKVTSANVPTPPHGHSSPEVDQAA